MCDIAMLCVLLSLAINQRLLMFIDLSKLIVAKEKYVCNVVLFNNL
jgi:hypothetical protein